jgi:hypothetical protein
MRQGDKYWVAHPDSIAQVEIIRGAVPSKDHFEPIFLRQHGGYINLVFVREGNDTYAVPKNALFKDKLAASIASANLGSSDEDEEYPRPPGDRMRQALATNEGMMKGFWKVILSDGTVIQSGIQTKKFAVSLADKINRQGYFDTGISGFRREEKL